MKHTDTAARVRDIFQGVLGRQITPEEDIRRANEPKWDSLKHMELMFSLEEKFGIIFSEQELEQLDSLSKIISRVANGDAS